MQTIPVKFAKSVQAVLGVMHDLSHATVQEVMDAVNLAATTKPGSRVDSKPRLLSLTSTYRALNTLVAVGTVKPIHFNDGQVRYELNLEKPHSKKHEHHHHFVCTQCTRVEEIDACPVAPLVNQLSQRYRVQYHTFEVFGICDRCGSP